MINKSLEKIKKEFSRNLFISISFLYLFFLILGLYFKGQKIELYSQTDYYLFCFIVSGYMGFLISKLEYNFVTLYRILLLFLVILAVVNSLIHCYLSVLAYAVFIPLLLLVDLLYAKRITVLTGIFFMIFCFFAKSIALYFGLSKPMQIPSELHYTHEIGKVMIVLISTYFTAFLMYYKHKIHQLKFEYDTFLPSDDQKTSKVEMLQEHDTFKKIYQKIIKVLEEKKCYQDPEFSKDKLAEIILTNETYISKAIKLYGHKNLKALVNQYRIHQVEQDFMNNEHKKHHIEFIYTKAGFTQQSTFNRVFKEFTGSTPSEYIDRMEE